MVSLLCGMYVSMYVYVCRNRLLVYAVVLALTATDFNLDLSLLARVCTTPLLLRLAWLYYVCICVFTVIRSIYSFYTPYMYICMHNYVAYICHTCYT